jgi:hypothetical protein
MRGERWVVIGYDGNEEIEKFTIASGMMSEAQIKLFLQRLAGRNLSGMELMATVLKKGNPSYSPLLETQISRGRRRSILVGSNPHYVASLWQDGESEKDN